MANLTLPTRSPLTPGPKPLDRTPLPRKTPSAPEGNTPSATPPAAIPAAPDSFGAPLTQREFRQKYDTGSDSVLSAVGLAGPDGSVSVKELVNSGGLQLAVGDLAKMKPADRAAATHALTREAQAQLSALLSARPESDPERVAILGAPSAATPAAPGTAGATPTTPGNTPAAQGSGAAAAKAPPTLAADKAPPPAADEAPAARGTASPKGAKGPLDLTRVAAGKGMLRQGSTGEPVRQVQERLIAEGYLPAKTKSGQSNVDGVFGKATKSAVWNYQRDHGLATSGLVGKDTVGALFPGGAPASSARSSATSDAKADGATSGAKTSGASARRTTTGDDAPAAKAPHLPLIEGFEPGVYGRGTREIQAAQDRLDRRIETAASPEERERLEAQKRQWEACSFHTTRRAAQLGGVSYEKMLAETGDPSGEPRAGFGAWHKRGVVLSHGGQSVWEGKDGALKGAYDKVQLGDFVSIGNGGMSKHAQRYDDLAFEEGVRHSGVVVGKNEAGVPIVEHSVKGQVYREPIDDLSGAHMGYQAVSIFRAKPFADTQAVRARAEQTARADASRAEWNEAQPFVADVKLASASERAAVNEYVAAYQDLREDFGAKYGVTPQHLDRSFQDLMAIGIQESNFDNRVVRTSKDGVVAKLGDQAKQWFTGETLNPLQAGLRDTVRWVRDTTASVTPQQATENAAYNREHGLKPNVASWRKEAAIAERMRTTGLGYDETAKAVNAEYGKWETPHQPSGLRSHGTFKIKEVPEKAAVYFDGASNGEENYGLGPQRFFKTARGNTIAGLAMYEQNYAKARALFPADSLPKDLGWGAADVDNFYRQVAVLAHNAPSKAFNRDFVNFYIAPVVSGKAGDPNPDRERFRSDYTRQIDTYRAELWG